jgi:CPA2 family monovalent cation:H+ antiporter-2
MHLAPLIQDLAVILGVAALVTFFFRLIKQPVVLGYIVAGIIVGPYTPDFFSVVDTESVKVWAELGVILLMFALGLEFSFRRLAKVGISAGMTAVIQILTMIILGNLTSKVLGWSSMDGIFLGCMIAVSSTTIIIKALEELGLKTKRFAELVFGILIVEDLAAIIMLVALSNIASKASLSGMDLLSAGGKLALVVGAWLVIGMFIVPRLIRAVGRRGNDEMMIVFSLGLCLALVSLSAYFHYSVALGAFIMGSILAETREVHRIEELVTPLKDMFGAVFFVSVGMLLDPQIIFSNWASVLLVCAVIIIGKVGSVAFGTLLTGQTLGTAVHSGFSMAQIGEFSFIIATLGLNYKAIRPDLYPIIVAASLITTFTTPYLIQYAGPMTEILKRRLSATSLARLDRYGLFIQRRSSSGTFSKDFYVRGLRWLASMVVVLTIFMVTGAKVYPWLEEQIPRREVAQATAWLLSFAFSAPFIWAMLTAFRAPYQLAVLVSRIATVVVLAIFSLEFFAFWILLLVTGGVAGVVFFLFRRRFETFYQWFEDKFIAGMGTTDEESGSSHAHLVPWDAHLAEITVDAHSSIVGQTLIELGLRERFGMNVVVIQRGDKDIVAPKATERIYPGDVILCFGTDDELERFDAELIRHTVGQDEEDVDASYALRPFEVQANSRVLQRSIRDSGIREQFDCMVVGIERQGQRLRSPKSDLTLEEKDLLWVVGNVRQLQRLQEHFQNQNTASKRA